MDLAAPEAEERREAGRLDPGQATSALAAQGPADHGAAEGE